MNELKNYSYKVLNYNFGQLYSDDKSLENKLNSLGKEGWELVSVLPLVKGSGSAEDVSVSTDDIKFIFKRD